MSSSEKYFASKARYFLRHYDKVLMDALRAVLGPAERFGVPPGRSYHDELRQFPHYAGMSDESNAAAVFFDANLDKVMPILQGPFVLGRKRLVSGPWRGEYKQHVFAAAGISTETVRDKRVLDVGCNAGFDTFYLAALEPAEVVGIEPSAFCFQAMFLWTMLDAPNSRFVRCRWQDLTVAAFGQFDIINCQGILYHEPSPVLLLQKLFELLAPGGQLILETHVTLRDGMQARFVDGSFWGDDNWWWITDNDTTAAMLRAIGFETVNMVHSNPVPSKNPDSATLTVEGVDVGGRAVFVARRPEQLGSLKSF